MNADSLRADGEGAAAALATAQALTGSASDAHISVAAASSHWEPRAITDLAKQSSEAERLQGLAVAVLAGRAKTVRALMSAGADPRSFFPAGYFPHCTALHLAVLEGQWACAVELLHAHDGDPFEGARLDRPLDKTFGATPLAWAEHAANADTMRAKCQHALAFYTAADCATAGDVVGLEATLLANPGLASSSIEGQPRFLLHYATDWPGHRPNIADTVACLVSHGADPNAVSDILGPGGTKETPLHWCASNDDVAGIVALVEHGASQTQVGGSFGNGTALWDAAVFAQKNALKQLLALGSDPYQRCRCDRVKTHCTRWVWRIPTLCDNCCLCDVCCRCTHAHITTAVVEIAQPDRSMERKTRTFWSGSSTTANTWSRRSNRLCGHTWRSTQIRKLHYYDRARQLR